MKKAFVDKEKCIGCGTCAMLAPDAFELDENYKARVKNGADLDAPEVKQAAESCPVAAITIE
jgi:ferredoxin